VVDWAKQWLEDRREGDRRLVLVEVEQGDRVLYGFPIARGKSSENVRVE
jgi:hypothetical protein